MRQRSKGSGARGLLSYAGDVMPPKTDAVETPTETTDAEVVDESQQTASPPASETPSVEEAPPAEQEEPAPAEVELPSLSDEDKTAFIDLFGDQFQEHPKFKELIARNVQAERDREKAEARTNRDNDPLYTELQTAFKDASSRVAESLNAIRAGDDVDVDELNAGFALANEWAEATERRGQMFVADAVLQRLIGIDDGKLDTKNPVHSQYQELVKERDDMLQNVHRLRRSGNAQQRSQAPVADATAAATFIHKAIELGVEHGKALGVAAEKERGKKTTDAAIHTTKSNTMVEAIAKARQTAQAGKANGTASAGNLPSDNSTVAERLDRIGTQYETAADRQWWDDREAAKAARRS